MVTKAQIFNLALGALLLQRQIVNPDTDTSNEGKVLTTWYDIAFRSAIADMDLDSTSTLLTAELVARCPIKHWDFAYKYPSNCAFFRRIQSCQPGPDGRYTAVPKHVAMFNGQKVVFTNQCEAVFEVVTFDFHISSLTASAALAIAYRLAVLSAPLATGKGAQKLIQDIAKSYQVAKAEAQAIDERENFNFNSEAVESEFVAARLS